MRESLNETVSSVSSLSPSSSDDEDFTKIKSKSSISKPLKKKIKAEESSTEEDVPLKKKTHKSSSEEDVPLKKKIKADESSSEEDVPLKKKIDKSSSEEDIPLKKKIHKSSSEEDVPLKKLIKTDDNSSGEHVPLKNPKSPSKYKRLDSKNIKTRVKISDTVENKISIKKYNCESKADSSDDSSDDDVPLLKKKKKEPSSSHELQYKERDFNDLKSETPSSDDDVPLEEKKNILKNETTSSHFKLVLTKVDENSLQSADDQVPMLNSDVKPGGSTNVSSSESSSLVSDKDEKRLRDTKAKKSSVKRKRSSSKIDGEKEKEDSRKLSNMKRYLKLCGVHVVNYKRLFEEDRSMKAKERKVEKMLVDLGIDGRPTLQKCKRIRLKREEAHELAELDQNCILSNLQERSRRSSTLALKETVKQPKQKRYDFGDLSVDSDCSISSPDEQNAPSAKKRKIIHSSSDSET